jgi:predicted ferric reductase
MGAATHAERRAWVAAYVAVLVLPMLLMFVSPYTERATTVFAVAVGFTAYVGMAMQVVLASRLPSISRAVGVGPLIRVHRFMGMALVGFVLVHVAVIFVFNPWARSWLWTIGGAAEAWAGALGFYAMLLIAITSIWRTRIGLSYERWRQLHVVLTAAAIGGAYVHVLYASDFSWSGPLRWLSTVALVAAAGSLVYLRVGRAFGTLGSPWYVAAVRAERGDAATLVLQPYQPRDVHLAPGQFAWLKFHGRAYSLVEHPFSISSGGGPARELHVTIRASGDTTRELQTISPGTAVLLDGPHGGVHAPPGTRGWLLLAGGIGITPAMSIIRTHAGDPSPPPMQLVYGVRDWHDATFHEELGELAQRGVVDLHVVASRPPATWTGRRGRIDARVLAELLPPDRATRGVLVCGPASFTDDMVEALVALGVPANHIHAERFSAA